MKKLNKFLNFYIIFVIVLTSLALALFLNVPNQVKKYIPESPKPFVQNDGQTEDETIDWLTYENEEIGIELKYPGTFKKPKIVKVKSSDKKHLDVLSGERIRVSFGSSKYGDIYFTAYTSDYEGFIDRGSFTGSDNITSECSNPLEYNNKGDVCKIIEIDDEKAIWENYFSEIECSSSFGTKIYFNNKKFFYYSGLSFLFYLENTSFELDKVYNNCMDKKGNKKAYSKAVDISKGIMEEKNLSDNDLEKIEIVNKMIRSFKFTNP